MTANKTIALIFKNIGSMLEILGDNPFKIRAYKNASLAVSSLDNDIKDIADNDQLTDIKGIGKDLAAKIREFLDTGKIEYYDELKSRVPEELLNIKNIQGIGPKLLQTLFNDFNVRNISDLEDTLSNPDFIKQKGVGTKKINELKVGIKLFLSYIGKINLGIALPNAELIVRELSDIPSIEKAEITGDLKRGTETVESIDILVSTEDPDKSIKRISGLLCIKDGSLKETGNKINFIVDSGIAVQIEITNKKSFNILNFINTGPEKHVESIEEIYKDRGINFRGNSFQNESEIYSRINMPHIPPELREDKDCIESAKDKKFDGLVSLTDIKGDLHTHSTWSDGKSTIKEMAVAAKKLGYEYIAITDHSVSSRIANGLDIDRLMQKKEELTEINNSLDGINIIFGSEVDIKPDGSLDYPDEILKELDMVVASVHSSFKMNEEEMTSRITKALSNPYVGALGHPTGRLIGERNPYKLDINAVIDTAKIHGKALEVNSSFMRLDLKDEHIKMATEKGVKLIISTDAHNTGQLNQMRYGIITAKRGYAEKDNVINTLPYKKLRLWLNTFK